MKFDNPFLPAIVQKADLPARGTFGALERILAPYLQGEHCGRSFPKETLQLEKWWKESLEDPSLPHNSTNPMGSVQSRCPSCESFLMLGKPGQIDSCPMCDQKLIVVKKTGEKKVPIKVGNLDAGMKTEKFYYLVFEKHTK